MYNAGTPTGVNAIERAVKTIVKAIALVSNDSLTSAAVTLLALFDRRTNPMTAITKPPAVSAMNQTIRSLVKGEGAGVGDGVEVGVGVGVEDGAGVGVEVVVGVGVGDGEGVIVGVGDGEGVGVGPGVGVGVAVKVATARFPCVSTAVTL